MERTKLSAAEENKVLLAEYKRRGGEITICPPKGRPKRRN